MAIKKFKNLVHFMIDECKHSECLGATRLNKALWFADITAYKMNGQPVTEEVYVKRKNGPVPAHILEALEELNAEGKILVREPAHKYAPRKFISLITPESGLLADDERRLARATLEDVLGHTANEISELTHDIIWEAAAEGEELPMCATLVSQKGELSSKARNWASEVALSIEHTAA